MNRPTRILLVDDDPVVLRVFSEILSLDGYEVREASTGRGALQIATRRWPDLVVLDVLLPDLTGLEICQQIKADKTLSDVFVVLFSGQATSSPHQIAGLEMGADEYLVKTIPPEEFRARIRTLVRLRNTTSELRASQERHRQVIELLPDIFCLIDPNGRILSANLQALKELGYAEEKELTQKSVFDLLPPSDHDRMCGDILATQGNASPKHAKYQFLTKSGAVLTVEVSLASLLDAAGPPLALVLLARNTTERESAEKQIRLLADAVGSANECISVTDSQNRLVFINRAFVETYGYREEEVLGKTPEFLYSPSTGRELCQHIYEQTLIGNWHGEVVHIGKGGTELPISLSTSRIQGSAGNTIGLVGVGRDISERKRAERQNDTFSLLGYRLSSAGAPEHAARIILEVASDLFGWDAGYVHLYSAQEDKIVPLLTMDTLNGQRVPVLPTTFTLDPSPFMRELMKRGARHIDRKSEARAEPALVPFGDTGRPSASLMYAPIRSAGTAIGILSVQSYTPGAYASHDLTLLQTLADYCGDALHRIDVTEALRKAEAKYRSIFENATEGIFQITPDGRYRTVNVALARTLGFDTPSQMISTANVAGNSIYVSPKKREELKQLLEKHGAVEGFEVEHRRKDGSPIWVRLNAHVVRDTSGGVLYYEGTSQEVTERRWAEQLLRVQRDFGTLLSAASGLTSVVERLLEVVLQLEGIGCGAIYLMEEGGEKLHLAASSGLSKSFVRNASHVKAGLPKSRAAGSGQSTSWAQLRQLGSIVKRLKAEGATQVEVIPILDGERILAVLTLGSQAGWEIPSRSVLAVQAIAAQAAGALGRLRAEDSLRASQETREKMLNSLESAVFVVDAGTLTIQECNSAATKLFGYAHQQLVGESIARLYHQEAAFVASQRRMLSTAEQKTGVTGLELIMRRKDGSLFPSEQNATVVRDKLGKVIGWISAIRDTTERKRAEAELRTLSRRTIEVQEAERMRIARELHDGVNQTLASVKMRLHKARDLVAAANPAAREILTRCERLLGESLEANRDLSHNLHPRGLTELGLTAACRNICKELRRRTDLVVNFRIFLPGERLPAAVELNLFRVLQEALNNLEKHAQAEKVWVRLTVQGGSVVLKIRDDGRGFNASATGTRKGKEPGIGLANMRQRAMSIGGICEVESVPAKGTTITVRVPLDREK